MSSNTLLHEAVALAKEGKREEAVRLAKRYIRQNMEDERGWYALAKLSDDPKIKRESLQQVLKLNPDNVRAQEMLGRLDTPKTSNDAFQFMSSEASPRSSTQAPPIDRPKVTKQSGSNLELWLGMGVVLIAIVGLLGLGYYAYTVRHMGIFGLFGPDLNESATVGDLRIRYPSDWNTSVQEGVFLAWTNDEPIVNAEWVDYQDALVGSGLSAIFLSSMGGEFIEAVPDNMGIVLMPVTPEVLAMINASSDTQYDSAAAYLNDVEAVPDINEKSGGTTLRVKTDVTNRTIADVDGRYAYMTFYVDLDNIDPVGAASFMAAFERNGQEYIFVMNVWEKDAADQKRLAERILNTIEFVN